MRPKRKLLLCLLVALMMGMATSAFADLSCAITTVPAARGIVNGHWENTGDLTFTCVAPNATPTADASITVYFGGLTITNTPTLPAGHTITLTNTSGALGAQLDATRSDTGTTGVSNSGSLIAIQIPAQAVPAAGTFVLRNVLLSVSGFTTAGQSVSAYANVISQGGNVSLTGSPVVIISQVLPALNSTTNPPALAPGTSPARFSTAGAPLPSDATCSSTACLDARSTFAVTVTEDHIDSWRSPFQYYNNGNGTALNPADVLFTFSGMLPGSIISNCFLSFTSGSIVSLLGSGIAGSSGTTNLFAEFFGNTNMTAVETLTLTCGGSQANPAYLPGASVGPATTPITVSMSPFPTGTALPGGTPATSGGAPRYNGTGGTVGPVTVMNFNLAPNVTGITPNAGGRDTTVQATISGTGLAGATAVTFSGSGVTATIGSGATATTLPVAISIGASAPVGLRTLTVTALAGTSPAFSGFTVSVPPVVTGISPAAIARGRTLSATISGNNLTGASVVTFSGTGVTATIGSGATSTAVPITITASSGAALGLGTFQLTTPEGVASYPFRGFVVTPPPEIISFTPPGGGPGTQVTLSGKNWSTATAVSFNGTPASSFTVLRNDVQLLTNPGFESGDLSGWTNASQPSSAGSFYRSSGTLTPLSSFLTVGPRTGNHYAVSDMNGYASSALLQSFTVPAGSSRVILSFSMFVNDWDSGPYVHAAGLDFNSFPNQHARVDILGAAAASLDTGPGVLKNFYLDVDPHFNPNPYRNYSLDITDVVGAGGTFKLRFAQVDNQSRLHMGIDDVSIVSESTTLAAVVPVGATSGPITVTTPQGNATSSNVFDSALPTITSITPNSGLPGEVFEALILGNNLDGAIAVTFSGAGVTGIIEVAGDSMTQPVTISIAPDATPGPRTVTVETVSGTSLPFSGFTITGSVPRRRGQVISAELLGAGPLFPEPAALIFSDSEK